MTMHGYSAEQVDQIVDVVRAEGRELLCASAARARAARPEADAATKLVIATLNDKDKLPLPLSLYEGGREVEEHAINVQPLIDEGHEWRITKHFYSSGVCEVRASLGKLSNKRREKLSSACLSGAESESAKAARFQSSIARSRKSLLSRCYELGADHLITPTKRGKFDSVDACWSAWAKFNRLASKRWKHWRAVCVPELHADGVTWHMHVAVRGFYSIEALRILWYRALGGKGNERGDDTPGAINIKSIRGSSGASGVRRNAAYISKYIGKGFRECDRGRRLFAASRGLAPHRIERWRCNHRVGIFEMAFLLQGRLVESGSSGHADIFSWSRRRLESKALYMAGFVLSTDWSGVQ